MSLTKYISESERAQSFMIEGDVFVAVVNEELALEFDVSSHTDDSVVIETDEYGLSVLEGCGCTMSDDDEVSEGKMKDSQLDDAENMSKAEFIKKHGREAATNYFESAEVTTNYSDQARFHERMGNKDTAAFYMKKHHAALAESFELVEDSDDVADAIKRRLMTMGGFSDLVRQYGVDRMIDAIEQEAELHADDEEMGSSDVSAMVNNVMQTLEYGKTNEAKYQGREVKLGKPSRGDVKKFKVYVKDPKTGNVKKVNFGDPNMEIRRDNPDARKNFRARHNCSDKKDRTKAGYWSCRMWSKKPVSKITS